MSAFVVSNETINRVLHLLDLDGCACPRGHVGDDGDDRGQKLWELNARAVEHRYRQEEPESPGLFAWSPRNYTKFELLKAGWCWMYQCSEGEQFTNALLFSEVDNAACALANSILSHLPAYDALPWDAPHNPSCVKVEPTA